MRIMLAIVVLILIALIPQYARAADPVPATMPSMIEWSQAQWKQHNGKLYLRVKIGAGNWCFIRSTSAMTNKSSEWEYAAPAVVQSIPATIEEFQVCTDSLPTPEWVVAPNVSATDIPPTRPLKNAQMVNTWRIAVDLPCEAAVPPPTGVALKGGQEYHYATNSAGQRGITICAKK